MGTINREPAKTRYSDFDAPDLSIEDARLDGETLSVKLKAAAKTTKVELHIDGTLVASFADELQCALDHRIAKDARQLTVYAYDRFLNCGHQTAPLAKPA